MAISRSLMNRQLRANGGIMEVTPRENFGLGSKLKKFVRKIIPNEVADIAVKAAPFVAPFNPALAAGMSGLGTFDQTGSISSGLKSGAMNYAIGQGSRYLGGADFQGNPFSSTGGFTPGTQGSGTFSKYFSKPTGSGGIKDLFQDKVQSVQGVGDANIAEQIASDGRSMLRPGQGTGSIDLVTGGADGIGILQDTVSGSTTNSNRFTEKAFDLLKKGTKAAFYDSETGKLDKAAVLGAATFAASYAEALALAKQAGLDLTEEEYDEAQRAEKKEEYASYLTNFFGGKKDGGRIGYEGGANELIMEKLKEEILLPDGDTSTEEYILIMGEDGMPIRVKKSDYEAMPGMFMDTTTSLYGDNARGRPVPEFANGGRIGYRDGTIILAEDELAEMGGEQGLKLKLLAEKFMEDGMSESDAYAKAADSLYANGGRVNRRLGSPEKGEGEGLMEMLSVEVDAGGDEEEDMLMAYSDVIFNRREKGKLFRSLGDPLIQQTTKSFKDLHKILKNPGMFPEDEFMLKEFLKLKGFKDGGRIGLKDGTGSSNRVAQLMLERDYLLSKDEDVSFIDLELERDFGIQMKAEGGIMEAKVPTGQMKKNNAGVAERDYRQTGGFVPVGIKERADDVPAMLSKNEFVMTADAVRGIGNGDVEEGSKKLYNTMKQAEQVGKA
mgnify:CR=1 FL=1